MFGIESSLSHRNSVFSDPSSNNTSVRSSSTPPVDTFPGCMPASLTEALDPLVAVEPFLPAANSHPGPAYEGGEGVFQTVTVGKYTSVLNTFLPVMHSASSLLTPRILDSPSRTSYPAFSSSALTLPGCTPASPMESPKPFVTVEPLQPAASSHPGPVYEDGEGVFQTLQAGKYTHNKIPPLCVTSIVSSHMSSPAQSTGPCSGESSSATTLSAATPLHSPSPQLFSIYYQNVRGMRSKIAKLRLLLSSCDYDVIVFSETWLGADIDSAEISSDYNFYRCDRSELTSKLSGGGGVLIAVKTHLSCEVVSLANCTMLEQVSVCVQLKDRRLYILAIYLPPKSNEDLYKTHAMSVQHVVNLASATDIIISLGDFNLPKLLWQFDEDVNGMVPCNVSSVQERALIDTIFATGLQQINRLTNSKNRLLDLAFVSLPERLDSIEPSVPLLPIDKYHPPFVLLFDETTDDYIDQIDSENNSNYDFHSCNYGQLKGVLEAIDWESLLVTGSANEITTIFYEKLYSVLNDNVSRKRRTVSPYSSKPWWTPELRHLRNILRKTRHRFFLSMSENDRDHLREVELLYKSLLSSTYENYLSRVQSSLKRNPSYFWDFIKSRKSSTCIPNNVSYNDVQSTTNEDSANLFATFFENVFSKSSPVPKNDCFAHIPSHNIDLPVIQFSTNEVMKALEDLDVKKGSGTDGIPPAFIKNCARELACPIAYLFNRSLLERTFPAIWKTAYIVPIHKSGRCNQVTNYRGVSILCCLSKVFERLMHNILYNVVSPIISESQHGFMKQRSTTTNLMCYVNVLYREVEARHQVDAVYIDFAKAFDTVPHILVVEKLRHIGFPDSITEWIYSYLRGRTAYVVVNSARSRDIDITSGVPQGSVLGPLLFNIFINDLCFLLSSLKLSFADDLKLYRIIASKLDTAALQEDLNALLVWCGDNGMRVNDKKCKIISFGRIKNPNIHDYWMETTKLDRVSSICDLGVTIDSKLNFNEHVGIITAKAFSMLGFIRRHAFEFTDIHALKTLYCTMVRSILEYAAPIWSPHMVGQNLTIERVQKRFLRFALRNLPWNHPNDLPPYPDRCKLIGLESLSDRRKLMQRMFIFDLIGGNIDCSELLAQISFSVSPRRLRNSTLFSIPYHRTNYGYNCPFDSCLRLFNVVCDEFDFNLTKNVFKSRIKNYH